jgi:hypothetical protein
MCREKDQGQSNALQWFWHVFETAIGDVATFLSLGVQEFCQSWREYTPILRYLFSDPGGFVNHHYPCFSFV